jgi:NAD+ synthase (glutamine-hydrolysing)
VLDGCVDAPSRILHASQALPIVAVVGLPLQVEGLLYNCAAVLYRGKLLGIVPKAYLPN